jgi:hypothetical protein
MDIGGSGVSGREAFVTLVACVLLVFEVVPGFVIGFGILTGVGGPSYLLYVALALVGGGVLGAVLLRQGGISVPSGEERGASRGALVGLVVGVVGVFLTGNVIGVLGTCVLVGLAVGRPSIAGEGSVARAPEREGWSWTAARSLILCSKGNSCKRTIQETIR